VPNSFYTRTIFKRIFSQPKETWHMVIVYPLITEIIDTIRFVKDDKLASYAFLDRCGYKTGNNEK